MKKNWIKKTVTAAMLCAMAYVAVVLIRVPVVLFLKYEPKDVIIAIGGFLFGPLMSALISLVVSAIEMVSISDTGWIGFLMNVLSSCAFACPAALIYRKKHTIKGAVVGLIASSLAATMVMLLWNYFLTPIYMGQPREAVEQLLLPAILPFNLLKNFLNATIVMLIYPPVVSALRRAKLVPESSSGGKKEHKWSWILIFMLILASCILLMLVLAGVI